MGKQKVVSERVQELVGIETRCLAEVRRQLLRAQGVYMGVHQADEKDPYPEGIEQAVALFDDLLGKPEATE